MHAFIVHTESANCTLDTYNDSGIEMAELSFEGLDGAPCNLSVTTTESVAQCLEDIDKGKLTALHMQWLEFVTAMIYALNRLLPQSKQ